MALEKHKVFISYHHGNDQGHKEALTDFNDKYGIFIDASVDSGDIDDELDDEAIREKIRDEYLQDSSVTIVLVGTETRRRKHVDWEIYSSMYNGAVNKQSGILVINLLTTGCTHFTANHGDEEKAAIYPDTTSWTSISEREEYDRRYPYMPERIIDNLLNKKVKISVTNWDKLTVANLRLLIDLTYKDRTTCEYDLSRPMRRENS
jgi:hypothetical protein